MEETRWLASLIRAAVIVVAAVSVTVTAEAGFLDVEWTAPTTNADGSPLLDLAGYRVYTGTVGAGCPGDGFQTLAVSDASPAVGERVAVTLTQLTADTSYSVQVTAVDTSGNESECAAPVSGVARPDVDVLPLALSFGDVAVGTVATLSFTVHNPGRVPLTGTVTTAPPFSVLSGASLDVAPGASQTVSVRFAPLADQVFAGRVVFTTSGDDVARSLTGSGVVGTSAVLQFSQDVYSVAEGGAATITVTRSGGMHGGVTVTYATSNGSATAGADYAAKTGTLTFGPGVTSQTFTLSTTRDKVADPGETILLTLGTPLGAAVVATPNPATLTVTDGVGNRRKKTR